jgi:acyl-CoA synthetase (AMP-forming)/AMP-acid ligase II
MMPPENLILHLQEMITGTQGHDRLAIVSDEASLRYGELLHHVEALASALEGQGIGPGNIVLAHLDNVPAFIVAILACVRVGCTFAPLDAGLTDSEIQNILELAQSDIVVCQEGDWEKCSAFSRNLLSLDAAGVVLTQQFSGAYGQSIHPDIACMQFSSGSTGAPKAILLNKEAFYYRSFYLMKSLGLGQDDKTLCALPLTHTHGAECLALPTLLGGGVLFLKSPKFAFPLYILEELEELGITFFSSIPQFYDFAVRLAPGKTPDLSALRHPFCGSAALSVATAELFHNKYGVRIKQGYGLAELSVICINMHDNHTVCYDSIGKPIAGIEWKIDGDRPEGNSIANKHQQGELLVRSRAMFSGYLGDEISTSEKLKSGWLHTGDMVSVDSTGLFRVVGRKEDFIKVNGFKVYASEIEQEIIGLEPIQECAVLAEKDRLGAESILACIVPKDPELSIEDIEQELDAFLRERLSDYKIPKRYLLVNNLPKNALGKILKSKISLQSDDFKPLTDNVLQGA